MYCLTEFLFLVLLLLLLLLLSTDSCKQNRFYLSIETDSPVKIKLQKEKNIVQYSKSKFLWEKLGIFYMSRRTKDYFWHTTRAIISNTSLTFRQKKRKLKFVLHGRKV